MEEERAVANTFESSLSELNLSPDRARIVKEGFISARENKDLFQARLISSAWSLSGADTPRVLRELSQNLEQEWEGGNINIKFDTQLEDETVTDDEEILFRKIQRCTDQNEGLKSVEKRAFAVVVPSYWKEEKGLPKTLASVSEQRFDDTVIVVVSDNNDEEGKGKFDVGDYAKGKGANVATGSIFGNIASARRRGVDRALKSEKLSTSPMVIISTDSDSYFQESSLKAIRSAFEDSSVIATTGPLEYRSDEDLLRIVEAGINRHIKERTKAGFAHLPGANTAVRADIYKHIGGYCLDYQLGEDGNLAQKIRDYLKYEGRSKGEKATYLEGQIVSTSARKYLDEEGRFSEELRRAYDTPLFKEYFLRVAHGEGLLQTIIDPRDVRTNAILLQMRKWKDRLMDLKYLFSGQGEERVRNIIRILRPWDNFYQRVNNLPRVKRAILKDTKKSRTAIDSVFRREFEERGMASPEGLAVLSGTVLKGEDREVFVFVFKKPSEKGKGDRFLAVEVERDPSSDSPPIIASFTEIDEGAAKHFTKVSWYEERMYFHPDDDYPRAAAVVFTTHHASISKVPTENVDVLIGEEEVRQKTGLLRDAYDNSKGDDNPTIVILHEYIEF